MQYFSFNSKKISLQVQKFIYEYKRKKRRELEEDTKKPSLMYRALKHYQDCIKEMFEIKPYSILDKQDKWSKKNFNTYNH